MGGGGGTPTCKIWEGAGGYGSNQSKGAYLCRSNAEFHIPPPSVFLTPSPVSISILLMFDKGDFDGVKCKVGLTSHLLTASVVSAIFQS